MAGRASVSEEALSWGALLGFLSLFLWGHFFFAISDYRRGLFGGYLLELPVLARSDAVEVEVTDPFTLAVVVAPITSALKP